jgi:hypothetical protein
MPKTLITAREFFKGEQWLGPFIGGPTFEPMATLLIASRGEQLTPTELELFTSLTGRTESPTEPVEELWIT